MDNDFEKYKNDHKNMMDEFYKSLDGFGSASDDSFFEDLMGDSDLSAFGGGLEQTSQDVDVSDLERKIAEAEKLASEIEEEPAFAPEPAPAEKSPFVPSPFVPASKSQEPAAPAAFSPAPQAAPAPTNQDGPASAAPAEEPAAPSLPKWLPNNNWTPTMVPFVIRRDTRSYEIAAATVAYMYGALDRSMGEPADDQKLNAIKLFMDIIMLRTAP